MKYIIIGLLVILAGCATNSDQLYYDASKAISKDQIIAQAACWNAIAEIAKGGDSNTKIGAITLAEKCKVESTKVEPPKKNWFGF